MTSQLRPPEYQLERGKGDTASQIARSFVNLLTAVCIIPLIASPSTGSLPKLA